MFSIYQGQGMGDPRFGIGDGGVSFSHKSELDLAAMVSDFVEDGSAAGVVDSNWSSDSESVLPELAHLSNKILLYRQKVEQHENDLLSIVHSFLVSIKSTDPQLVKSGQCSGSCIIFSLVKFLRSFGYDAAVCSSKWPKDKNIPGGDHEYVDVLAVHDGGRVKRVIIEIDFRSHFEIARAVDSYNRILESLPVVYVGSINKLKKYLKVMVDAAKCSLYHNSMPLPPWRSRAYLQAKWESTYKKMINPEAPNASDTNLADHQQCVGHLSRLKSSLQSKAEGKQFSQPITKDETGRLNLERWKYTTFISRAP